MSSKFLGFATGLLLGLGAWFSVFSFQQINSEKNVSRLQGTVDAALVLGCKPVFEASGVMKNEQKKAK